MSDIKKRPRTDYERRPTTRLKRYIRSNDPVHIEKRKLYAENPVVKSRRKELNQKRRLLSRLLIELVKKGYIHIQMPGDADFGQPTRLDFAVNRVICKDKKLFADMDNDKNISWYRYDNEIDLNDKTIQHPVKESEVEFHKLVERFISNDPAINELLATRKQQTPSEPDLNAAREIIKSKITLKYIPEGGEIEESSESSDD